MISSSSHTPLTSGLEITQGEADTAQAVDCCLIETWHRLARFTPAKKRTMVHGTAAHSRGFLMFVSHLKSTWWWQGNVYCMLFIAGKGYRDSGYQLQAPVHMIKHPLSAALILAGYYTLKRNMSPRCALIKVKALFFSLPSTSHLIKIYGYCQVKWLEPCKHKFLFCFTHARRSCSSITPCMLTLCSPRTGIWLAWASSASMWFHTDF